MVSKETKRILRDGVGFRCREETHKAVDLISKELRETEFETEQDHEALCGNLESVGMFFDDAVDYFRRRPAKDKRIVSATRGAKAAWLGDRKTVKCRGPATEYSVPKCAKVVIDKGKDGALVMYPSGCRFKVKGYKNKGKRR